MSKIKALIIGMANTKCIQDANDVDSFLRVQDVKDKRLLIGIGANKPDVTQALQKAEKLTKEDTFILYFAGHTDQKDEIKKGSEKDGKEEILQLYGATMTDDELTASIKRLKCTVICIFDTCYAVGLIDKIKSIKGPEIHVFAAAQEDETAWDNRFTAELLKALKVETQVDHWDMNQHSFKGSPLFFLHRAFRDIESMWNNQSPAYFTNIETEKEIPMPASDKKIFRDRKGQPLNSVANVDDEGVIDVLEGVEVRLAWDVLCQNQQYVNTGYSVTHCNGTSPISVIFHKATPDNCLELVRDRLLPDLYITLFGDNNMEMDLRHVDFDIQGWCQKPFARKLTNPTKQALWEMIGGYFTSLSMRLKFKGQDFDFGKVGAVGLDGARKAGGASG
jgi:hypothetical protein